MIHVDGTIHGAGCPADVSHGAVRVIEVEVIATAGSAGPRAGPGDALTATAGTSDSPWRDQRADDSGLRRLTQIGWDRTIVPAIRGGATVMDQVFGQTDDGDDQPGANAAP